MGHFYFDESIHDRGGFIIGAFVFARDDINGVVRDALVRHGLEPGKDEYKSSAKMATNPQLDGLRQDLRGLVAGRCSVALVVLPIESRKRLGTVALRALNQFLTANRLAGEPHTVSIDAGIEAPVGTAHSHLLALGGLHPESAVHFGCDSHCTAGLQLADCAAHTAAIVLLETMGIVRKEVPGREEGGWEPDDLYPLGFELWATMRHAFFNGGLPPEPRGDDMFVDVHPYGLYVAPECSSELAEHAMKRFGTAYLGCIH